MNDNEVRKALERCSIDYNCGDCPYYYKDEGCCPDMLMNDALDLINRQKAEIERLEKNIDGLNIFTTNHMKVIRVQAIKEFAERLRNCFCVSKEYLDIVNIIDNLVKEMTENNFKE